MTSFDLSATEGLAWVASIMSKIYAAAGSADEVLLVGALARDLHLHFRLGLPIVRDTHDLDVAVCVSDWTVFDALVGAFSPGAKRTHRTRIDGVGVDVVPFGDLERPPGFVEFEEDRPLTVLGLSEALRSADSFVLPGGVTAKAPSLPLLTVLKILAWIDRGRGNAKDAIDLGQLLPCYAHPPLLRRLYEEDLPVLEACDWEIAPAAARLLGRDASSIVDPATQRVLDGVDRERLVREITPFWFQPDVPHDVAPAVHAFLGEITSVR